LIAGLNNVAYPGILPGYFYLLQAPGVREVRSKSCIYLKKKNIPFCFYYFHDINVYMKPLVIIIICVLTSFIAQARQIAKKDSIIIGKCVVDASCGKCRFGISGDDCELAVRINGKAYLVDNAGINNFGDAHAKDGFCNAVRKAEVKGIIVNNRFRAEYFKLLPAAQRKKRGR
jgi:hypothetical protein